MPFNQMCIRDSVNAATCRALEGGYMSTKDVTYIRNSSFYLTDAVATEPFLNDDRNLLVKMKNPDMLSSAYQVCLLYTSSCV